MEENPHVKILLIERAPEYLSRVVQHLPGTEFEAVANVDEALAKFERASYDIIVSGFGLNDDELSRILDESKKSLAESALIVCVMPGKERTAISAFMRGAVACVVGDESFSDSFKEALDLAFESLKLKKARKVLEVEREQLLSIMNSLDVPAYVSDPDTYDILFANSVVVRDLGDVLGKKCYEAFQGLSEPCPFCTNRYIFGKNAGKAYIWEFQNRKTLGWFRCIDKAIPWPDGRLVRAEIAIDITDKKLAEDKLIFQASLLDACEEAVIATDASGTIMFWNKHAEILYETLRDKTLGENIFDLPPAVSIRDRKEEILSSVATGVGWSGEIRVERKDQTHFHSFARVSPLLSQAGEPSGSVWTIHDITERKRTEEALRNIINETNARREEITALLESSKYILEHEDFEDSARTIFATCKRLLRARSGFISRYDEKTGEFSILYMDAGTGNAVGDPSFMRLLGSIQTELLKSCRTVILNNLKASAPDIRAENALVIPLKVEGRIAGAFCIADKGGGFSRRDVLMAEAFCEITSLALRNARVLELLSESETRYKRLVEKAPDIIYVIGRDGLLASLNPAFKEITGWDSSEWIGKPWQGLVHEEDIEQASRMFESVLRGGEARNLELRILSPSGHYLYLEFTTSPHYEKGEITGLLGIARDITDRKRKERELVESRTLYQTFLALCPDPVFITDNQGCVIDASQAAAEAFGYESVSQMRGISVFTLVAEENREFFRERIGSITGSGVLRDVEMVFERRDGSTFFGELHASVLRKPGEDSGGYIMNIRDITLRKKQQEEIQRINIELEGYAHAVSHDLRGPLGTVAICCDALKSILSEKEGLKGDPEILEITDIIEKNIQRCDQFINELLTLAETGQKPVDITDVDISELVEQILKDYEQEISERSITVMLADNLGSVRASRAHMYQLFGNLLRNSIFHAIVEKPVVEVLRLESTSEGKHTFKVRDNGPGLPEDEIERIFEPYYSSGEKMTGIGLAIVQKIVKTYSGEIRAYNDKGACFEFTIYDA